MAWNNNNDELTKMITNHFSFCWWHKLVTKQGIKDYHRYWYELFPSGDADKHDFLKYAEDVFQNVEETNTDYLFRAMDSNKYVVSMVFIFDDH